MSNIDNENPIQRDCRTLLLWFTNSLKRRPEGRVCRQYAALYSHIAKVSNEEYHPSISNCIAQCITWYIQSTSKRRRKMPDFLEDVKRKLFFLRLYNQSVIKFNGRFPYSEQLVRLLVQYIVLEFEVLFCSPNYDESLEEEVENRITRNLELILFDSCKHGILTTKTAVDASSVAALKILTNVKTDHGNENKLYKNIINSLIVKFLKKIGMLTKLEEIVKNKSFTSLQNPVLQSIRQNLIANDYVLHEQFSISDDEYDDNWRSWDKPLGFEPPKHEKSKLTNGHKDVGVRERIVKNGFPNKKAQRRENRCASLQKPTSTNSTDKSILTIEIVDDDDDGIDEVIYFQPVPQTCKDTNRTVCNPVNNNLNGIKPSPHNNSRKQIAENSKNSQNQNISEINYKTGKIKRQRNHCVCSKVEEINQNVTNKPLEVTKVITFENDNALGKNVTLNDQLIREKNNNEKSEKTISGEPSGSRIEDVENELKSLLESHNVDEPIRTIDADQTILIIDDHVESSQQDKSKHQFVHNVESNKQLASTSKNSKAFVDVTVPEKIQKNGENSKGFREFSLENDIDTELDFEHDWLTTTSSTENRLIETKTTENVSNNEEDSASRFFDELEVTVVENNTTDQNRKQIKDKIQNNEKQEIGGSILLVDDDKEASKNTENGTLEHSTYHNFSKENLEKHPKDKEIVDNSKNVALAINTNNRGRSYEDNEVAECSSKDLDQTPTVVCGNAEDRQGEEESEEDIESEKNYVIDNEGMLDEQVEENSQSEMYHKREEIRILGKNEECNVNNEIDANIATSEECNGQAVEEIIVNSTEVYETNSTSTENVEVVADLKENNLYENEDVIGKPLQNDGQISLVKNANQTTDKEVTIEEEKISDRAQKRRPSSEIECHNESEEDFQTLEEDSNLLKNDNSESIGNSHNILSKKVHDNVEEMKILGKNEEYNADNEIDAKIATSQEYNGQAIDNIIVNATEVCETSSTATKNVDVNVDVKENHPYGDEDVIAKSLENDGENSLMENANKCIDKEIRIEEKISDQAQKRCPSNEIESFKESHDFQTPQENSKLLKKGNSKLIGTKNIEDIINTLSKRVYDSKMKSKSKMYKNNDAHDLAFENDRQREADLIEFQSIEENQQHLEEDTNTITKCSEKVEGVFDKSVQASENIADYYEENSAGSQKNISIETTVVMEELQAEIEYKNKKSVEFDDNVAQLTDNDSAINEETTNTTHFKNLETECEHNLTNNEAILENSGELATSVESDDLQLKDNDGVINEEEVFTTNSKNSEPECESNLIDNEIQVCETILENSGELATSVEYGGNVAPLNDNDAINEEEVVTTNSRNSEPECESNLIHNEIQNCETILENSGEPETSVEFDDNVAQPSDNDGAINEEEVMVITTNSKNSESEFESDLIDNEIQNCETVLENCGELATSVEYDDNVVQLSDNDGAINEEEVTTTNSKNSEAVSDNHLKSNDTIINETLHEEVGFTSRQLTVEQKADNDDFDKEITNELTQMEKEAQKKVTVDNITANNETIVALKNHVKNETLTCQDDGKLILETDRFPKTDLKLNVYRKHDPTIPELTDTERTTTENHENITNDNDYVTTNEGEMAQKPNQGSNVVFYVLHQDVAAKDSDPNLVTDVFQKEQPQHETTEIIPVSEKSTNELEKNRFPAFLNPKTSALMASIQYEPKNFYSEFSSKVISCSTPSYKTKTPLDTSAPFPDHKIYDIRNSSLQPATEDFYKESSDSSLHVLANVCVELKNLEYGQSEVINEYKKNEMFEKVTKNSSKTRPVRPGRRKKKLAQESSDCKRITRSCTKKNYEEKDENYFFCDEDIFDDNSTMIAETKHKRKRLKPVKLEYTPNNSTTWSKMRKKNSQNNSKNESSKLNENKIEVTSPHKSKSGRRRKSSCFAEQVTPDISEELANNSFDVSEGNFQEQENEKLEFTFKNILSSTNESAQNNVGKRTEDKPENKVYECPTETFTSNFINEKSKLLIEKNNKFKVDSSKCELDDFTNSGSLSAIKEHNKIFAQVAEMSAVTDDSNDSYNGGLSIVQYDNDSQPEGFKGRRLSIYDEKTLEEQLDLVTTAEYVQPIDQLICISIPETEKEDDDEDELLKQVEDFQNNLEKVSHEIETPKNDEIISCVPDVSTESLIEEEDVEKIPTKVEESLDVEQHFGRSIDLPQLPLPPFDTCTDALSNNDVLNEKQSQTDCIVTSSNLKEQNVVEEIKVQIGNSFLIENILKAEVLKSDKQNCNNLLIHDERKDDASKENYIVEQPLEIAELNNSDVVIAPAEEAMDLTLRKEDALEHAREFTDPIQENENRQADDDINSIKEPVWPPKLRSKMVSRKEEDIPTTTVDEDTLSPIRTKAELKLYDKFSLSPYVRLEKIDAIKEMEAMREKKAKKLAENNKKHSTVNGTDINNIIKGKFEAISNKLRYNSEKRKSNIRARSFSSEFKDLNKAAVFTENGNTFKMSLRTRSKSNDVFDMPIVETKSRNSNNNQVGENVEKKTNITNDIFYNALIKEKEGSIRIKESASKRQNNKKNKLIIYTDDIIKDQAFPISNDNENAENKFDNNKKFNENQLHETLTKDEGAVEETEGCVTKKKLNEYSDVTESSKSKECDNTCDPKQINNHLSNNEKEVDSHKVNEENLECHHVKEEFKQDIERNQKRKHTNKPKSLLKQATKIFKAKKRLRLHSMSSFGTILVKKRINGKYKRTKKLLFDEKRKNQERIVQTTIRKKEKISDITNEHVANKNSAENLKIHSAKTKEFMEETETLGNKSTEENSDIVQDITSCKNDDITNKDNSEGVQRISEENANITQDKEAIVFENDKEEEESTSMDVDFVEDVENNEKESNYKEINHLEYEDNSHENSTILPQELFCLQEEGSRKSSTFNEHQDHSDIFKHEEKKNESQTFNNHQNAADGSMFKEGNNIPSPFGKCQDSSDYSQYEESKNESSPLGEYQDTCERSNDEPLAFNEYQNPSDHSQSGESKNESSPFEEYRGPPDYSMFKESNKESSSFEESKNESSPIGEYQDTCERSNDERLAFNEYQNSSDHSQSGESKNESSPFEDNRGPPDHSKFEESNKESSSFEETKNESSPLGEYQDTCETSNDEPSAFNEYQNPSDHSQSGESKNESSPFEDNRGPPDHSKFEECNKESSSFEETKNESSPLGEYQDNCETSNDEPSAFNECQNPSDISQLEESKNELSPFEEYSPTEHAKFEDGNKESLSFAENKIESSPLEEYQDTCEKSHDKPSAFNEYQNPSDPSQLEENKNGSLLFEEYRVPTDHSKFEERNKESLSFEENKNESSALGEYQNTCERSNVEPSAFNDCQNPSYHSQLEESKNESSPFEEYRGPPDHSMFEESNKEQPSFEENKNELSPLEEYQHTCEKSNDKPSVFNEYQNPSDPTQLEENKNELSPFEEYRGPPDHSVFEESNKESSSYKENKNESSSIGEYQDICEKNNDKPSAFNEYQNSSNHSQLEESKNESSPFEEYIGFTDHSKFEERNKESSSFEESKNKSSPLREYQNTCEESNDKPSAFNEYQNPSDLSQLDESKNESSPFEEYRGSPNHSVFEESNKDSPSFEENKNKSSPLREYQNTCEKSNEPSAFNEYQNPSDHSHYQERKNGSSFKEWLHSSGRFNEENSTTNKTNESIAEKNKLQEQILEPSDVVVATSETTDKSITKNSNEDALPQPLKDTSEGEMSSAICDFLKFNNNNLTQAVNKLNPSVPDGFMGGYDETPVPECSAMPTLCGDEISMNFINEITTALTPHVVTQAVTCQTTLCSSVDNLETQPSTSTAGLFDTTQDESCVSQHVEVYLTIQTSSETLDHNYSAGDPLLCGKSKSNNVPSCSPSKERVEAREANRQLDNSPVVADTIFPFPEEVCIDSVIPNQTNTSELEYTYIDNTLPEQSPVNQINQYGVENLKQEQVEESTPDTPLLMEVFNENEYSEYIETPMSLEFMKKLMDGNQSPDDVTIYLENLNSNNGVTSASPQGEESSTNIIPAPPNPDESENGSIDLQKNIFPFVDLALTDIENYNFVSSVDVPPFLPMIESRNDTIKLPDTTSLNKTNLLPTSPVSSTTPTTETATVNDTDASNVEQLPVNNMEIMFNSYPNKKVIVEHVKQYPTVSWQNATRTLSACNGTTTTERHFSEFKKENENKPDKSPIAHNELSKTGIRRVTYSKVKAPGKKTNNNLMSSGTVVKNKDVINGTVETPSSSVLDGSSPSTSNDNIEYLQSESYKSSRVISPEIQKQDTVTVQAKESTEKANTSNGASSLLNNSNPFENVERVKTCLDKLQNATTLKKQSESLEKQPTTDMISQEFDMTDKFSVVKLVKRTSKLQSVTSYEENTRTASSRSRSRSKNPKVPKPSVATADSIGQNKSRGKRTLPLQEDSSNELYNAKKAKKIVNDKKPQTEIHTDASGKNSTLRGNSNKDSSPVYRLNQPNTENLKLTLKRLYDTDAVPNKKPKLNIQHPQDMDTTFNRLLQEGDVNPFVKTKIESSNSPKSSCNNSSTNNKGRHTPNSSQEKVIKTDNKPHHTFERASNKGDSSIPKTYATSRGDTIDERSRRDSSGSSRHNSPSVNPSGLDTKNRKDSSLLKTHTSSDEKNTTNRRDFSGSRSYHLHNPLSEEKIRRGLKGHSTSSTTACNLGIDERIKREPSLPKGYYSDATSVPKRRDSGSTRTYRIPNTSHTSSLDERLKRESSATPKNYPSGNSLHNLGLDERIRRELSVSKSHPTDPVRNSGSYDKVRSGDPNFPKHKVDDKNNRIYKGHPLLDPTRNCGIEDKTRRDSNVSKSHSSASDSTRNSYPQRDDNFAHRSHPSNKNSYFLTQIDMDKNRANRKSFSYNGNSGRHHTHYYSDQQKHQKFNGTSGGSSSQPYYREPRSYQGSSSSGSQSRLDSDYTNSQRDDPKYCYLTNIRLGKPQKPQASPRDHSLWLPLSSLLPEPKVSFGEPIQETTKNKEAKS
ncbi:uncharacterized protein LOC108734013 isoform X2 [Agrilus planipennis]|uniref:Uncharacterized protein LOC108734013 isoform X2 n=1 Tax=Agrilus planipennis TaxID=224129 RepID=A0A7F5RL50_AGRPL|nr:uncharacterized protein LOC108734013 isoform X2 [Agrilus planipennis]